MEALPEEEQIHRGYDHPKKDPQLSSERQHVRYGLMGVGN
jgi:hypothetical protein